LTKGSRGSAIAVTAYSSTTKCCYSRNPSGSGFHHVPGQHILAGV
jgi:hypothetical protein